MREKVDTRAARARLGRGASGDVTYGLDDIAESATLAVIQEELPEATVLSEERGLIQGVPSQPVIVLDPLDGSSNAWRGIPLYSCAMCVAGGRMFEDIQAAGVVDLVHGEVILGSRTVPTRLNGHAARPSTMEKVVDAYVSVDFKPRNRSPLVGASKLLRRIRYPRFLGSAALEIAYVAIGRMDAFVEPYLQLRSFDCLPSLFLVERAGGHVRFIGQKRTNIDLLEPKRHAFVAAGTEALLHEILNGFGRTP